jgi:hypothetical protein
LLVGEPWPNAHGKHVASVAAAAHSPANPVLVKESNLSALDIELTNNHSFEERSDPSPVEIPRFVGFECLPGLPDLNAEALVFVVDGPNQPGGKSAMNLVSAFKRQPLSQTFVVGPFTRPHVDLGDSYKQSDHHAARPSSPVRTLRINARRCGPSFDPATRWLLEGSDIMNLLPMVMMLIDGSSLRATAEPPLKGRRI